MIAHALQVNVTQEEFGLLVGISQAKVSQLLSDGVLERGDTAQGWLMAYLARLREQAAGRMGDGEGLDLVQERAGLARAQREHYEIKNAVAQGEYAPIGLLADVLGAASAAVVDRLDAIGGDLRKACPDLPAEARDAIAKAVAAARNEWIRSTAELAVRRLDQMTDERDDDSVGELAPEAVAA